jgi:HEAT repeat protein
MNPYTSTEISADSIIERVMTFAPLYETIVSDYRANLYIKGRMDIQKKNFILRYVPSMFRLQKGVREYMLETYSDLHYTAPNIYDQKVKASQGTVRGNRGLPGLLEYFSVNIYSASLLNDERLMSPLAKNGQKFYKYRIDSVMGDPNNLDYRIRFIPKTKSDQLVGGYMIVSSNVWSVREIRFSGRSELITFTCWIKMGEVGKKDEFLPVRYDVEALFKFLGNKVDGSYTASLDYKSIELKEKKTRKKEKKKYNKAFDKYYEEMKAISLDPNALPEEEIADRLKYDTRKRPRPNELRIITQLLTEIKSVHEDEINELNYQTIQTVFQITRFLERELQFGSKRSKIQALKLIQSINGYASEAVLVRFLYHRELELRNSARYTYMWLSQGNPFRFFDEDIAMKLRQWDMMELHAILEHRKKVGYNTPSFIKWVNTSAEENVKIFFINEIRLYNETESAPILAKQINARSTDIRGEAIKTLGKLKYKEIEPKLIEMYHVQPEEVKRNIIEAISDLKTDKALGFLYNAYDEADNWGTKRAILKALYAYSAMGRKTFDQLERKADSHTAILFAHTKHPLINQLS